MSQSSLKSVEHKDSCHTSDLKLLINLFKVAVTNLSEHDVLSIQPLGLRGAKEELGAVGVGPSVGHGQDS